MAFNINEFKGRIQRYGGLARTSLFEVRFAGGNLPTNIPIDDARFFCQNVTMPGVNLDVMPYKVGGVGYPEFMPMNSTPESLNAVFMLDSSHRILAFFHAWINSVVNVSGEAGVINGLERKEINYKADYQGSMTINFFSAYSQSVYTCTYEGVYPTQVGTVTLNWADSNTIATLPVNFSYNRMIYSGFGNANVENSRLIVGQQDSIVQNNRIPQIIRDFEQRQIDLNLIPLDSGETIST